MKKLLRRTSRERRPSTAFGTWLRQSRVRLGLTQIALGKITHISNQTISYMEIGVCGAQDHHIIAFVKCFQVDESLIRGLEGVDKPMANYVKTYKPPPKNDPIPRDPSVFTASDLQNRSCNKFVNVVNGILSDENKYVPARVI